MIKVGDKAPDFEGITQTGEKVSLQSLTSAASSLRVILYFYPKDSTPGCTAEACSLRDGYHELLKQGFVVVGVSPDSETSHAKFAEKQQLRFPLIADSDKVISQAYGVWGEKKFMGRTYMGIIRTTFIINNGVVEKIFDKVDTKRHFEQIIDSYK